MPWQIAGDHNGKLRIPTIGIGAGADCDGQVLVLNDMLGLFKRFTPKFVRIFADLTRRRCDGIQNYVDEVRAGTFPSEEESFSRRKMIRKVQASPLTRFIHNSFMLCAWSISG